MGNALTAAELLAFIRYLETCKWPLTLAIPSPVSAAKSWKQKARPRFGGKIFDFKRLKGKILSA